ncbi:MAG: autotransporter-associated beta strand repeat-containing protein [Verrucomicrobiota bacterium]
MIFRHSSILPWFRASAKLPVTALSLLLVISGQVPLRSATVDWGVSQSGTPGIYSWQHLYNWTSNSDYITPPAIPSLAGDLANLNLLSLTGNQTINLNGAVTLGTLNLGDAGGQHAYTIAPGTGGSLVMNNGGTATINKSGQTFDVVSSNITLTNNTNINVNDGALVLTGVVSGTGTGIIKGGDGMLVLRGANTYTGANTLNGGMTLLVPLANDGAVLGTTAGSTTVSAGATLALGPDALGSGGIGNPAEPIVLNGNGFRNNGALRGFMGANGPAVNGIITLASAARIQNDQVGTLTLSGALNVSNELTAGGVGFVDVSGAASGASAINHYGIGGLRLRSIAAGQSYSGTINSTLGEIRADYGTDVLANAPYADVSALNLRNSWLRIGFGNAAGSATNDDNSNSTANSRFSTTAPISMASSQVYIDNASFSTTTTNFYDYAVIQGFGTTTITGGHNRIGFRSADAGSVQMTFADISVPNPGTTLELFVDSLIGTALGAGTKHRILNSAISADVPFVGGWAYTYTGTAGTGGEFVKYDFTAGNGYTALTGSPTSISSALATDNVRPTAVQTGFGAKTINSLNIAGGVAIGAAGDTLDITSGGMMSSSGTNTIAATSITSSGGTLYDIAIVSHNISADITGPIDLVKTGGGITSMLTSNSYTGTTYLNEGVFRGVIGSLATALGSGNLNFGGSPNSAAAYETDDDFSRALGTGPGQVQFLGGGGVGGGSSGINAYGAPVTVNLGGAGGTITWGSPAFNPGIFGLNVGGASTHALTFMNTLDFGGEQRYVRVDGSGSGTERGALVIMAGDMQNGSLVKRGGGTLVFDTAKTYENGTIVNQGQLWLRGAGTAGANVSGNDIQVAPDGYLRVESPVNIGVRQMIILQNTSNDTPAAISFGAGYGTGEQIAFSSLNSTSGPLGSGPNNILIANNQSGQARRVTVTISGNNDFRKDVPGEIRTVAPNVEAWFGADNGNGTFTGSTLSPSGGTGTQTGTVTAAPAYRLGGHTSNGGVLTIANANVLSDTALGVPTPLIVGAPDATDRNYTDGTVYIPKAQAFSGQVTVGQGGILWAGENDSLGSGSFDINLRAGELRLDTQGGAFGGNVGTQYGGRNLNIGGGTSTVRTSTLDGGSYNTVTLGNLTFDASRTLQVLSIGTNFTDLTVNNIVFNNSANTIDLTVGVDNSFQAGAGLLTVNGIIGDQATGLQTLRKNNGGVLVLNGANTFDGGLIVTQGRVVLSNTSAAGTGSIQLTSNSDRRTDVEYRINGSGPFLFNNALTTSGGNDGSTRVIVVGPTSAGSENQVVQIPSLTIGHAGTYTTSGGTSSAIYFDGANGYSTTITGNINLNRSIVLRTRGALTTVNGAIVSNSAANILEKFEQGTLWLNGTSSTAFDTVISNGYLVLGNGTALGTATTDVNMRSATFSQLLLSGTTNFGRNIINTATGSLQTIGGLDAGAKIFSGGINLSTRGVALTSIVGGDTTFSGVISGGAGFGIDKQGSGTVFLTNANTYSGTTTVSQGTLIGTAQAVGSPFGTAAITMADGELRLAGIGGATTTTAGVLTTGGGARLGVDATAGGVTTFRFDSLARSGAGSITFVPTTGSLNTNEIFAFTNAPTLANGIVGPWAVHAASGAANAAHYVTTSGDNIVSLAGSYGGTGDLDTASGPTQVFDAGATGGTLTADRSVFAFRTNANVNLGTFTLNLGDNATSANGGGMILNAGADINGAAGSRISIGNTQMNIYVDNAAVSSLNVPVVNTRNNSTNTLSTVFTKFGPGTLEIGSVQQFQGNLELNRGTISFTVPNALPMFSNLNGTTGSLVIMSPGTEILLNNNDQEFGNISAVNPSSAFQFSAGTLNLGTATLTVGRDDGSQTFNGQILGGAGSTLVKVGAGRLTLDNINGNKPNSIETVRVDRGVLTTWMNDNSWATPTANTSAIPGTATVYLRGGEWEVRAIGDSSSNAQRINIGNNVIHQGGDSIFDTDRATGGGSNKLLTFNNLTLDVQRFLMTGGNTFIPRFDGTITLTNHARVQMDAAGVFAGTITDGDNGYTLNKIGSSDLAIGGDNSASWRGGLVVTGGTLLFGTRGLDDVRSPGTTFVPLSTANAGTGDIIVNQGSTIRLNSPSNVLTAQGQEVRIYGSERGSTTRVDLLTDALITDYGLRSLTDGSIALGLSEGAWTTPINMARVGNGNWGLAALSNTYYTPTTLGAGLDNIYRFNSTSAGILSITNSGVVTGTASVVVGKDPIYNGATPAGSGASVRFYGDQNYTGSTTIYRVADGGSIGGLLEITGDTTSPSFDVYGRLTLRGAGRLTNDAGTQTSTLNLRPGGNLRLDYSMDVADSIFNSRLNDSNLGLAITENKLGDTTPLVLDGAGINLINHNARVNQEVVGTITVKGGAGITLERNGTGGQILLYTPSITRDGQSTLTIRENANELGSINIQSMKLILTGGDPVLTNGIVAPWMINATRRTFLSYNAVTGFTNAPFITGTVTAGTGDAFLSSVTATDVVQFSGGFGDTTLTGTKNVYALRVDEESSTNDMIFNGGQINIHSGGLILGSDDGNRVDFNTTNIYFGNGSTAVEGIVYGGHSTPNSRFGGVVTAANLTLDGPGGFQFVNTANAITGTIQLNGGRLYLDGAGTQGTASEIILHSNYANNFNGNQIPDLRLRHNSATTTYTGLTVTVAENVGQAIIQSERYTGAGTTTAVQFQNLNILGTTGPAGTLLRMNNSNSITDVLGTTTIGGTSAVGMNVNANTWRLMGSITGAAPIVKTGDGILRWDADNSGFTGGFVLNRGEWRLTSGSAANYDVAGTGDVELNFGTVRMAFNGTSSVFTAAGQDINVNGQTLFLVDRDGGSAASRTIGTNNAGNVFRTSNSPYLIFQSPSFGDDLVLENILEINDSPTFRTDSTDLFLRDIVRGNGILNKAGIWYLHFDNNAPNTWTGGFNNFTGVTTVRQTNATLGTGPVQVFAGTGLSLISAAQLGTTGLTNIFTSGGAMPVIGTRTIANFNGITAAAAGVIRGTGAGVLAIDNNQSLTVDPLMATRDGGVYNMWQLGSQDGNGNLTANSVTPWGTGGTEFRLGGGSTTLTVNPATAGAQFAGGGNKMIIGVQDTVMGYGTVTFGANSANTYGGGTLVTRSRNLDGGYRAAILSLQGGAIGTGTTFRTPLGTGQVDLVGEGRIEGGSGTAVTTGGGNANVWVMHPGSRLRFDNNTPFTGSGTTGNRATGTLGGGGRWGDTVGITLNSSVLEMYGDNADSIANREIIGDLTIQGGSEVVIRRDAGDWVELSVGNITRSGTGTLQIAGMVFNTNTANMLGTVASNVDSALFLAANGSSLMNNGMVAPWIISRFDNNFVKYDATLGFQAITQGGAPANYLTSAGGTLNGTLLTANDGTEILNLNTATGVLGMDLDVYALRTDRDINASADNAFNKIIIRSGGLVQADNQPTINANLYFGASGNGDGEALIFANDDTFQINGKIFASQVTKFGQAFLNIRSDQPQFGSNWVINNGGIQFLTPGAQGTGEVILNGAHMTDRDSTLNIAEVRYNFNSGTPDLFTWGGGKITVNSLGIIRNVGATDRLSQLPAVDLKTSGSGHEGIVFFQVDGSRHTTRTGTVTLYDNYLLSSDAFSFGPGSTTGIQLGAGTGVGGLNNQGLYDVRLSGDGMFTLGDNSASFTGNRTFSIGDGSVRVTHNGAFGASTVTAMVRSTGSIEVAVPNFQPTATLIQEPGSVERWAVSDARGTGNYSMPNGVHLQLFTDVTGTRTINLAGGSIMGYLPLDYDQVAVIQTIRSGVTVNLTANSFLGQIYPAGTSSGANHFMYDMGKLNTSTNLNPNDVGLRGSYLVIDGNITGNFSLTKVGQDVIKLAGANTFTGLDIQGGVIQLGRDNALLSTVAVTTRGDGYSAILDLNGYNQEIGSLSGPGGTINNSGFAFNTLTINQASNTTYGGSIASSVTLTKRGAGTLQLTGINEYQGGTILEDGTLSVAQDTSLGRVHLTTRADSLRFAGGTLQTTSSMTIAQTRGITLDPAGGTFQVSAGTTTQVDSTITGPGGLSKTGSGILQLNNALNNYTGVTNIVGGTLQASGVNRLAALSRHVLTGDVTSGALALNGSNQIIGSLASTGPTPANATVALDTSILTVGADRTQDGVYAGAITGGAGSVFRLNGSGLVQTLSTSDNSAQAWATEVANGQMVMTNGAKLGSGAVTLGVIGVSGIDDLAALDLQGITGFANNISVTNANSTGSTFITASGVADSSISGAISLTRKTFIGATVDRLLSLDGAVTGSGRITVLDGGTLSLNTANNYGTGGGVSGTAIDGGTVIRSGTVLIGNNLGAGAQSIELGDTTSTLGAAVDRASVTSILGTGSFNPNGNGAAGVGYGEFTGISTTFDGYTYTSGDVGTRILVAGEEGNPERNGVYVIVSIDGSTMNIARASDTQTSDALRYGAQVSVVNGTYGSKTVFMYEENVVVRNEPGLNPVRFREDIVNPGISLLQNAPGLAVANNMDVNATSAGTVTIGASAAVTTGTSIFSGAVRLQNLQAGVSETRTVQLSSNITGSSGVVFSNVINEVDQTVGTGDVLSISKVGDGVVTMSAANTYCGTTSVTAGRLQIGNGTSGSILGTGAVSVTGAATTLATAPVLAGGSATTVIAGAVTIGTVSNPGILAPGIINSATSNQSMTLTNSVGLVVANASQVQMSITAPTLNSSNGTISAWLASGNVLNDYITANPSSAALLNIAPGTYGDLDYINVSNGALTLGSRAAGGFGSGSILVQSNGYNAPAAGDMFNLIDWVGAMGGSFSIPGTGTAGGVYGDLDLPMLSGNLIWDLSAFGSHGIIAVTTVIPEPSRALFMLLGLLAIFGRRRRSSVASH